MLRIILNLFFSYHIPVHCVHNFSKLKFLGLSSKYNQSKNKKYLSFLNDGHIKIKNCFVIFIASFTLHDFFSIFVISTQMSSTGKNISIRDDFQL